MAEKHINSYRFHNSSVRLVVPNEESIKWHYQSAAANDTAGDFPYWARIWPSAEAMTHFLDANISLISGKKIVEIAAGCGLPAFFAANFAEEVIVSDYSNDAVNYLNETKRLNHAENIHVVQYNWHHQPPNWQADLYLLSDINYHESELPAVEKMLFSFLISGALVLLATPVRVVARNMLIRLLPFAIQQESFEIKQHHIVVYLLKKH